MEREKKISRHYHIITCDEIDILHDFANSGKVGIRPVIKGDLSKTIQLNWDILADIARVKKGDYAFLHAKGIIKGLFEVTDNPLIDFTDTRFFDGPSINTTNWKRAQREIQNIIQEHQAIWWIPIKPIPEKFFEDMNMDLIFDRIARGEITSLPQRLLYEDKKKTVKGVTKQDFMTITNLFYNYSSLSTPPTMGSIPSNMCYITFDYLTDEAYEKNLEAIIVNRIRSGNLAITNHLNVLNTVPLGYLKMADLLTWNEVDDKKVNPWVWELKRDPFRDFNELKEEIQKLSIRASYVRNLLNNGYKITSIILADNFLPDVIDYFQKIILPIGLLEEVILFSYSGRGANVNFNLVAKRC